MQLGIFAKTFPGTTPATVMTAAAEAGFACVQYNLACSGLGSMPDAINAGQADDIAGAAKAHCVSIAAVSGTYNMIHPDKSVRAQGVARLEVIAARCHSMGTRVITLCTGTRDAQDQWSHHPDNTTKEAWADLLAEMQHAIAIAERHDVDLGIEPELANVISSAAKARALIDELKSPRLKIVLDAANLFESEPLDDQRRIVSESIDLLADRIAMAHAKDRATDGAFVAAGHGVLDYPHYLASLRVAGFDGPLVTHGLSSAEAPRVANFLRHTLLELNA